MGSWVLKDPRKIILKITRRTWPFNTFFIKLKFMIWSYIKLFGQVGVGLMFFQQFGGINGIIFYASETFKSAGKVFLRIKSAFFCFFLFFLEKKLKETLYSKLKTKSQFQIVGFASGSLGTILMACFQVMCIHYIFNPYNPDICWFFSIGTCNNISSSIDGQKWKKASPNGM